ncbi:MAG: hypothetical protein C5S44_00300 [Candidatus Methanocomedens sp.]|jgi:hypothetical protein|nr:MAG: hypothetical protein C5S44_00300 [ANME-2 cluster archaeon]
MSTTVGGMLILVGETMFLFSMLNFVLVTRIQYYNPGDAYMRQLFPNYLLFLGALAAAALLAMIFVYIFVLPSKMVFSQQQAVKDERSPTHNLLMEVHRELQELRGEVDGLRQAIDKV